MDCFRAYFTHVQTCGNVRVQSATEWTASVHTLRMSKPVITFVFKVLRNGLLWCLWLPRVALCAPAWQRCTHNGADSAKTDVMKKARTLRALLLRAAKNQCFATTTASFCVCTPLKFRYGFFRSVQDKVHFSNSDFLQLSIARRSWFDRNGKLVDTKHWKTQNTGKHRFPCFDYNTGSSKRLKRFRVVRSLLPETWAKVLWCFGWCQNPFQAHL